MPTRLFGPDERSVLSAAVELYSQCLLSDAKALAYIESRAITRDTVERYRLGYCAGDALVDYLRWRRLPIGAARRVGLLTSDQREFFAGRVIVPEFRRGQPIWLMGRAFPDPLDDGVEKYLGLPGPKPLLGWEESKGADAVWVVEAPFDRLTLREWGVAAIALAGTRVRPEVLAALARFPRLVLCLNDDAAGQAGTAAIETAVGSRAIRCPPLPGVKDPNELGQHPDGQRLFTRLAQQIEQTLTAAA